MREQIVDFRITDFAAEPDECVVVEWQDKAYDSGFLAIELEESASNEGVLNYPGVARQQSLWTLDMSN
ncbi:MAG: hypothetical protein JOZ60_00955 [Verrucomicrobia bacterium]|nr:hypothetical protein [Verrucomicrobiota bacterium]